LQHHSPQPLALGNADIFRRTAVALSDGLFGTKRRTDEQPGEQTRAKHVRRRAARSRGVPGGSPEGRWYSLKISALESRSCRPDVPCYAWWKQEPYSVQSDSHVEDVLHTLADPEEFVRGIVASFIEGRFSRDEAVIRIGVSGAGIAPHYCIEQGWRTTTPKW